MRYDFSQVYLHVLALSNRYQLPEDHLRAIRARDKVCVYCRKIMATPSQESWRGDWATIEHLNRLPPWDNPTTVAICCGSCNSSRRDKRISDWFETEYCQERGINIQTVAQVVRDYLDGFEEEP